MIVVFFIIRTIITWHLEYLIEPNEAQSFIEEIAEDGLQYSADLALLSTGSIQYQMIHPKDPNADFVELNKENGRVRLSGAGQYKITVLNTSKQRVLYQLGTYADKEFEVDHDTQLLKQTMDNNISNLKKIYNANLKLKMSKEANIRIVNRDIKWLSLLLFMPIVYVGIAFVSYNVQKGFFVVAKHRKISAF